jgi:hypothetical protein
MINHIENVIYSGGTIKEADNMGKVLKMQQEQPKNLLNNIKLYDKFNH